MATIQEHYADAGFANRLWSALEGAGLDRHRLTTYDLRPLDEFHLRGRQGTVELLELARFMPNDHILDVGSGIGGPARYIASTAGVRVSGIDLTEAYCDVANELAVSTGLAHQVRFHPGDALNLPFDPLVFDGVWMQHVNMNIADKGALFRELYGVCRPGARLALHEVVAGEGESYFPVPWARELEFSHLVSADTLQTCWEAAGFETEVLIDDSAKTGAWLVDMQAKAEAGMPPLGIHLLIGDHFAEFFGNLRRGILEGKVRVIMATAVAK